MASWDKFATSTVKTNGQHTPALSTEDFASMYLSKSTSSAFNTSDLADGHALSPNMSKQFSNSHNSIQDTSLCDIDDGFLFCSKDNMENCLAYLNQELTLLGMPSIFIGSEKFDIVRLVNCTYDVLHKFQKSARVREEMENRLHRHESDIKQYQLVQDRLKSTLDRTQRLLAKSELKEQQAGQQLSTSAAKLKAEKSEVRRLSSVLSHHDAQYKHELKKKERECNRLKDKLTVMLNNKGQEKKIGLVISESLQRSDNKRGKWKIGVKQEDELYRMVIATYEQRQKELIVENTSLRDSLASIQKELVQLLKASLSQNSSDLDNEVFSGEDDVSSNCSKGMLQDTQLPYHVMPETIEKSLKEKVLQIKQHMKQFQSKNSVHSKSSPASHRHIMTEDSMVANNNNNLSTPSLNTKFQHNSHTATPTCNSASSQQVEHLSKQLEHYRSVIEQQESLLQESLQPSCSSNNVNVFTQESEMWTDMEQLKRQQNLFYEQKRHFEQERQSFTEAAIRLGKEKAKFDEEKAALVRHQFMQLTPFNSSGKTTSRRSHRLLPSTPHFSPAPLEARCLRKSDSTFTVSLPSSSNNSNNGDEQGRGSPSSSLQLSATTGSLPSSTDELKTPSRLPFSQEYPDTNELYRSLGMPWTTARKEETCERFERPWSSPAHLNGSASNSPDNRPCLSPTNPERVAEHVQNLKMALFTTKQGNPGLDHGNPEQSP